MAVNNGKLDQIFYDKINSMKLKLVNNLKENGNCHDLLNWHEQLMSTPIESLEKTLILYKKYEKLVLDLTYQQENQLAKEDFERESSAYRIKAILDVLGDVESLCQYFTTSLVNVPNNSETSKCLLWRKGALLYMYCSTIYADPQRQYHYIKQPEFSQFLVDGASYLRSMLTTSAPIDSESVTCNSADTLMLLSNGIRDSTDMLALMYAGEMLYWHATLPDWNPAYNIENSNSSKDLAIQFLKRYIHLVDQPVLKRNWSCDRARELLHELTNGRVPG